MGRTKQSVLVLCQTGPGAVYYRGVRRNAGAVITLTNAVQSSGGFDVTNPNDGTRYEIRPEGLTIVMNDRGHVNREPVESVPLVNGDEIQIGKFRLVFVRSKPESVCVTNVEGSVIGELLRTVL